MPATKTRQSLVPRNMPRLRLSLHDAPVPPFPLRPAPAARVSAERFGAPGESWSWRTLAGESAECSKPVAKRTAISMKMVRPERFELPAFWFVAEFHPLHPTTPANQTQQNNRRRCYGFCPVLAGFGSSSRTENGQTRMARKNARCKTGVFQLAESAKIQHGDRKST